MTAPLHELCLSFHTLSCWQLFIFSYHSTEKIFSKHTNCFYCYKTFTFVSLFNIRNYFIEQCLLRTSKANKMASMRCNHFDLKCCPFDAKTLKVPQIISALKLGQAVALDLFHQLNQKRVRIY